MNEERGHLTVSLLVHNLNRADSLSACLASIGKQNYRPLELVLLDAGSTDDSPAVIKQACPVLETCGIRVTTLTCPKLGVAASRNLAARQASGDLLCFLDNDALFRNPGDVAESVVEFETNPQLAALGFRVLLGETEELDPFSWLYRRPAKPWAGQPFETFIFAGAGFCVRASAFWTGEGFWEALPYAREEEELGFALLDRGWTIAYNPAVTIRHFPCPRGRLGLLERRRVELRNGILVLWRRLPVILAIPAITGRIVSMSLRLIRREGGGVSRLWAAIPEAWHVWRRGRFRRLPISFASAWRYLMLHRPRGGRTA